ncbi:MAG: magnesium chelatase [Planctomycetes bacterium]|nr:magnesium chelatase [Planctomycetota bacterium]
MPRRLGDLDPERFPPVSVREEIRRKVAARLQSGTPLFPGIVGYDETVIPQLANALLARHDVILLGLRGQAKTRLCRMIAEFLDEAVPAVPGCPLRSHPLRPLSRFAERRIAEEGSALPLAWLGRGERYAEKLATPDVTMADLIGDVDPLKAAHRKLDLSDEEAIHFGIIPRTNRGIFNVNELPDLAPRIQVGLLNVLEERDFQIRGFPIRIPLDVLLIFTANPEDYTNRGRIITPLKDRIASQILTHYPRTLEEGRAITEAEAWQVRDGDGAAAGPPQPIPDFICDILEEIAREGRRSEYVDQSSGVSARLPIAARELLVSQVERRALRGGARAAAAARLLDLAHVIPAITGKVELVYEGEQEGSLKVARHLLGSACRAAFDRHFPDVIEEGSDAKKKADRYKPVLDWFAAGNRLELAEEMSDEEYRRTLDQVPGLRDLADKFLPQESPHGVAAAMELVLEGLHQHSLLAKEEVAMGASYSDMLGVMLKDLE